MKLCRLLTNGKPTLPTPSHCHLHTHPLTLSHYLQGAILCFSQASSRGDAGLFGGHRGHPTEPHQGRHQVRAIQYSLTHSHHHLHTHPLTPSHHHRSLEATAEDSAIFKKTKSLIKDDSLHSHSEVWSWETCENKTALLQNSFSLPFRT